MSSCRFIRSGVSQVRYVLLAGLCAGALLVSVNAQKGDERGQLLFREHCAACHGEDAKGNGPVAPSLKTRPADLTQIQGMNEKFPFTRVRDFIDGERVVPPHGSREMPIWGTFFRRTRGGFGKLDIRALVRHVESIQETAMKER